MNARTIVFGTCLLLAGAARAQAGTYLTVENLTDTVAPFGSCGCTQAEGWLTSLFMGFVIDGETLVIVPADYYPKKQVHQSESFYLINITKRNPVGLGATFTSKKIVGLPDTGFIFDARADTAGFSYCEQETVGCGGYSTGLTDAESNQTTILPGVGGSDTVDFQVYNALNEQISVLRVTFWPGMPPPKTK